MIQNKKNGFTLVECLVAISILMVGILSNFILVTRALFNATVIEQRLTASFLAQEGIELVRNIRDTNFIKGLKGEGAGWKNKLTNGCYTVEALPTGGIITLTSLPVTGCGSIPPKSQPLKLKHINSNSDNIDIYGYSISGEETPFYREIEIEGVGSNEIKVVSHLMWKTKNTWFDLHVEDHLYNWLSI